MRPTGLLPGAIAPDARDGFGCLSPKVFCSSSNLGVLRENPRLAQPQISRVCFAFDLLETKQLSILHRACP